LIQGTRFPMSDSDLQARLRADMQRAYRPAGTARQLVAIATYPDRSPLLARLSVPTHIVHGREDPMIPLAAGVALKARIPGATLDAVDGMGHDLPPPLFARFALNIDAVAGRA
jgi:pimeloyl-ACP methyl ester carboxylesterase